MAQHLYPSVEPDRFSCGSFLTSASSCYAYFHHIENEVERLAVPRLVMDEMRSELAGMLFVGAN